MRWLVLSLQVVSVLCWQMLAQLPQEPVLVLMRYCQAVMFDVLAGACQRTLSSSWVLGVRAWYW